MQLIEYSSLDSILYQLDTLRGGVGSRAMSRMTTPLVNAQGAETALKSTIYRNWKQIQQQCRQRDTSNSGTINVVDLKGTLPDSTFVF